MYKVPRNKPPYSILSVVVRITEVLIPFVWSGVAFLLWFLRSISELANNMAYQAETRQIWINMGILLGLWFMLTVRRRFNWKKIVLAVLVIILWSGLLWVYVIGTR